MAQHYIRVPFEDGVELELRAGDQVFLTGTIFTARDAAHKRMVEQLEKGEALPIDLTNQAIYYVGPTPAKPGAVIGSAGPTTSSRMDKYTPRLLQEGLKGMIGKGYRSKKVIDSIAENNAVYFAAIGGSGALLAQKIKSSELIAYEDLGTEAIRKIEVENFPCIVVNDHKGGDWYKESQANFKQS
ncbi:Fe-S-containing hydro-lyase [Oceanobacillus damuensis]|uniref:Fe-S-containing hydro-lyase n=1 Tax=Oceanobacillus damuensis TaxID=937928 RepID=UPI00082AA007|nr:Fe-S-containing hydro-lyase [Oceanobacillus damuensis]